SFILVPADGGPVMRHRPGQYLTFALDQVPGSGRLKRNYSISSGPDSRAYRISVKREARPGTPPGLVSNWLHDHAGPGTQGSRINPVYPYDRPVRGSDVPRFAG